MTIRYLEHEDLPRLFLLLDDQAVHLLVRRLRIVRFEILLGVVTTIAGGIAFQGGGVFWAGVVTTVALIALLLFYLYSKRGSPNDFREYRLIAEQIKSLAWRYVMKAPPFDSNELQAADRFFESLVLRVPGEMLPYRVTLREDGITQPMRTVRSLDLAERIAIFRSRRLKDLQMWYARTARQQARRKVVFDALFLSFSVLSISASLLWAFGFVVGDLVGLTAAVAGSIRAWSEVRDYESRAEEGSVAVRRLGTAIEKVETIASDSAFGSFVNEIEAFLYAILSHDPTARMRSQNHSAGGT